VDPVSLIGKSKGEEAAEATKNITAAVDVLSIGAWKEGPRTSGPRSFRKLTEKIPEKWPDW
jgi:hypothetical protein